MIPVLTSSSSSSTNAGALLCLPSSTGKVDTPLFCWEALVSKNVLGPILALVQAVCGGRVLRDHTAPVPIAHHGAAWGI